MRWCERAAGHQRPHRGTVATVPGERAATLVLAVESAADDGRNAMPVVLVRDGDAFAYVHLDWDALHSLGVATITAGQAFTAAAASWWP